MIYAKKLTRIFLLLAISLIMSACSGFAPAVTSTPTIELPTSTSTATINWFPATATLTPLPTQAATSTPETIPGLGELIFSDNFFQPNLWSPSPSNTGNSIINNGLLTLTIPEGTAAGVVTTLRSEPVLSDFYFQITAQLGLCRGKDQYNLIFRVYSPVDFYRFSITCGGELRLERVVSGKPFVIKDWTPSPDAPLGAPGEVKISIFAAGQDLRFFLNDHFQFNVSDNYLNQGGIGVSIRSDSGNPMTVSFSKLSVYAVASFTNTPLFQSITTATPTK
jgi:hypothetical protein